MMMKCKLSFNGIGEEKINIGDTNVAPLCHRVLLQAEAGKQPTLHLNLQVLEPSDVEGEMDVFVDAPTAVLLMKLGWTPPQEQAEEKPATIIHIQPPQQNPVIIPVPPGQSWSMRP